MIRFNIWNSLTNQTFNNVQFSKHSSNGSSSKKCINLVYGSNAIGKSSFSKIIHSNYDKSKEVVNSFDNSRSTIQVIEDQYNILKAFRYDREFAQNSTGVYENRLVIAPNTGSAYADLEKKKQEQYKELISVYKNSKIFKSRSINAYTSDLKTSKLYTFSLKAPTAKDHAPKMYDILRNLKKDEVKCSSYSIEELIEVGLYIDESFNEQILLIKEKIESTILTEFPETSSKDYNMYNNIIEYLNGNSEVIDKLCLMCGETILTKELIESRIDKIKGIIKQYSDNVKENKYNAINNFQNSKFTVNELIKIQELFKSINNQNASLYFKDIFKIMEKYDIKFIKNNFENCILNMILDNKMSLIINNLDQINTEIKRIQSENVKTINNDVKDKFIENLERLGFKYFSDLEVTIDPESKALQIQLNEISIVQVFQSILSESEKTILSLSLFLSIASNNKNALILIDDPVDSHDEKTKWFIVNQIIDFYQKEDVLLIIFTHDLSLSKTFSSVTDESIKNYVMTQAEIKEVMLPSLYFQETYCFIYDVIKIVKKEDKNAKYIIPLAFLMRYLAKNQKKLFSDTNCSALCTVISRKEVKDIGFKQLSEDFVHYNISTDSEKLLSDLEKFMIFNHKDPYIPLYIKNSISSDELILGHLNDIGDDREFDIEIKTILYSLLIRNTLEKHFLQGVARTYRDSLGKIAENYRSINGADESYLFYIRNKTLVDDFSHIESGSNVLLSYDLDTVKDKQNHLNLIIHKIRK